MGGASGGLPTERAGKLSGSADSGKTEFVSRSKVVLPRFPTHRRAYYATSGLRSSLILRKVVHATMELSAHLYDLAGVIHQATFLSHHAVGAGTDHDGPFRRDRG